MAHATMKKFGYPESVVAEYDHWVVQMRPRQATLGALVLIAKSDQIAFAALPAPAFPEMRRALTDIEGTLSRLLAYDKINYLMLMMVDPQVHFHVLPRYERERIFAGARFADTGWPGPPDLSHHAELSDHGRRALFERLRAAWPSRSA